MNKYLEVFRLSFKMQITWRFDVVMTAAAAVFRILAAWIIWNAVFSGKALVGGFTFQAMLSYYIVSSFLASLDMSPKISDEVSLLIREGRFSGYMVTPISPFGFFGARAAGEAAFRLGFSLFAALLCAALFRIRLTLAADIAVILPAVMMLLLGLLFMTCFHCFLGILTFRFLSNRGLLYVANHLTAFATGAIVPLALLPEPIEKLMALLPFYYVTYLPAMLLTGRGGGEAAAGLLILALWTLAFIVINRIAYLKLRIRYDGVGI